MVETLALSLGDNGLLSLLCDAISGNAEIGPVINMGDICGLFCANCIVGCMVY